MKCPFCKGSDVRERGKTVKATKKKQWRRVELAVPFRRYFCGDCKQVFRNPA